MTRFVPFIVLACISGNCQGELVHYYSFDSQTARDSVGNNDGTINGNPSFVPGASGEDGDLAINLNEEGPGFQDDFVGFDQTEFGDTFTISAWIKPNGDEQVNQMMAIAANTHGGFAGPDGFKWAVNQWDDPDLSLRLETGDTVTGTNQGTVGVVSFDDEWQHVAIAFDKEALTFEMFHDGSSVTQGGVLEFSDDLPWQIGAYLAPEGGAVNAGFLGAIDSVAVFDEALTEDDILDIFSDGIDVPDLGILGDFDGDLALTAADIDLLSAEGRAGTNNPIYDVNGDSNVDEVDHRVWVEEIRRTYFGDSNLDSVFNSTDFVAVFTAGEYEDGIEGNSTWSTGDWNGDGEFDSSDFVASFTGGGYELPPRAANAVPEPPLSMSMLALSGLLLTSVCRRRFGSCSHLGPG